MSASYYQRQYGSVSTPEPDEDSTGNYLDKLTDQQLISEVEAKEIELKHLRLENRVFIRFLELNDPMELEGLENLVDFAQKKAWTGDTRYPVGCLDILRTSCVSSGRRSIRHSSFSSLSSIFEGRGPKVNLSQKTDMMLKAMEELQTLLVVFIKKSIRTRMKVKGELEEYCIRERDIKESVESFEYNMAQAVDRLTQRIPAEKFIRWMEEWQKSAQFNIEKLRLRTASLKIQYKKVSTTLIQRQELRENVHAVDFDQLEIENKHFAEKLELKNFQLIEMKRMSGSASLVLNKNKKQMRIQQDEYNAIKDQMMEAEKMINRTEEECEKIEEELQEAEGQYNSFKKLTLSYKVPDVMEYVDIKRRLNDLKNEMKVWYRRKKIQDITINACLRQMKNITGSSKIDRNWLEDLNAQEAVHTIDSDEAWDK